MPLYVTDYLGDTMHLTTEQHGAYLLMLMACWKGDGYLAADDESLAAITRLGPARWKAHRSTLLRFFKVGEDTISHGRVIEERANALKTSEARKKSGAEGAARRWQNSGKPIANAMANGMAKTKQTTSQNDRPSPSPSPVLEANTPTEYSSAAAACPHSEIIALYHEILPELARVKTWDGARPISLRARWREDKKRQSLDYWRRFFTHVAKSDFLMGRVQSKDRTPFVADLEWLITARNFAKIIEGKYHAR